MKTWTLSHGLNGWQLDVKSVPAWAHLIEGVWGQFCWLFDPCCRPPWRQLFWRLPERPRYWWQVAHMWLLNLPPMSMGHLRSTVLYSTPVDAADAARIEPEFVAEIDEMWASDG